MSEEIKYCNICRYLGLDFKTGSFYCSLSHKKDKLPDVLSCEDFKTSDYIQRLKQENEELKARFNEIYNNAEQLANKYNKYDGKKENELAEIINKTTDERNKYKQENEELKAKRIKSLGFICDCEENAKYKQTLEEIREVINCSDKDDCDNCPGNDFCEELCDSKENLIYVLKTII